MAATLGECLSAAERYFAAAETGGPPVRDSIELAIQTRRMIGVLGRYLDNVVADPVGQGRAGWQQAAAGIGAELRAAGGYLDRVLPPADHPLRTAEAPADPAVAQYARAVDALTAGADLLRTHTSPGTAGYPVPRSDWAQLLTAEPVVTALVGEVTGWARRAERMVDQLLRASDQPLSKPDLAAARDRLAAADSRVGPADTDAAPRDLLHAIPTAAAPERIIPSGHESDTALCKGIDASARRLRAAAFAVGREPGDSPALSGLAWRQEAHASAIICDLAAQSLHTLTGHPATKAGKLRERMRSVASCFVTAREAWRHAAWMWQTIATDTTSRMSRTTTDASDLVLRLGRLAFGDHGWTPATTQRPRPRTAEDLAPDARALAAVLGAVHEAADAITRIASADLAALDAVRRADRLYMSARTLDQTAARHAYLPAPADRVHMLKNAYYLCADTSWQAGAALDGAALEANASSKVLALFRAASAGPGHKGQLETGFELDPDAFAGQKALFNRSRGTQGRRRSQINPDEIIRAYENEHLTLEECGTRFSISAGQVRRILAEHGSRSRTVSQAWKAKRTRDGNPSLPLPASQPGPNENAPLYHQLRKRGINDPGLLERAAMIDQASADVLRNASRNLDAPPVRTATGRSRRSPAELAAADNPSTADTAVRPAAAIPTASHDSLSAAKSAG